MEGREELIYHLEHFRQSLARMRTMLPWWGTGKLEFEYRSLGYHINAGKRLDNHPVLALYLRVS